MFYRYFEDKVDLLAALAESFLSEVKDRGMQGPADDDFFVAVVASMAGSWFSTSAIVPCIPFG